METPRKSLSKLALLTGLATAPACTPEANCPVSDVRQFYTWSLKNLNLDEVQDAIEPTNLITSPLPRDVDGLIETVDGRFQVTINLEAYRDQFTTQDGSFLLENYLELVYAFGEVENLTQYVENGIISDWVLVDDAGNYKPGAGPSTEDLQDIIFAVDEVLHTELSPNWTYIIRDDLHSTNGNDIEAHNISGPYNDNRVMIYTQYAATKGNVYDFAQNQAETSAALDLPNYLLGINMDFMPLEYTGAQSCEQYGSIDSQTPGRCLATPEDIATVTDAFSLCPDSPRGLWGLSGDYQEIASLVLDESTGYPAAIRDFSGQR